MDKKFFVPYQTARQLKEKGYNEECTFYYGDGIIRTERQLYTNKELSDNTPNWLFNECISAPTYHEVLDWLEEKGIRIEVRMAYRFRERKWSWCGYVYVVEDEDYETSQLADWCSTREEAINVSILKALEML